MNNILKLCGHVCTQTFVQGNAAGSKTNLEFLKPMTANVFVVIFISVMLDLNFDKYTVV